MSWWWHLTASQGYHISNYDWKYFAEYEDTSCNEWHAREGKSRPIMKHKNLTKIKFGNISSQARIDKNPSWLILTARSNTERNLSELSFEVISINSQKTCFGCFNSEEEIWSACSQVCKKLDLIGNILKPGKDPSQRKGWQKHLD